MDRVKGSGLLFAYYPDKRVARGVKVPGALFARTFHTRSSLSA